MVGNFARLLILAPMRIDPEAGSKAVMLWIEKYVVAYFLGEPACHFKAGIARMMSTTHDKLFVADDMALVAASCKRIEIVASVLASRFAAVNSLLPVIFALQVNGLGEWSGIELGVIEVG